MLSALSSELSEETQRKQQRQVPGLGGFQPRLSSRAARCDCHARRRPSQIGRGLEGRIATAVTPVELVKFAGPTHPLEPCRVWDDLGTIWAGRQSALTRCASLRVPRNPATGNTSERKKSWSHRRCEVHYTTSSIVLGHRGSPINKYTESPPAGALRASGMFLV